MSSSASGPRPEDLRRVALAALERVRSGMTLGLGTGRAAEAFIQSLGERVREGLAVRGVPTSVRSQELAASLGIPLVDLADLTTSPGIDLAVDGADEVAPDLGLTKGLGGALLRERVVAHEAASFVVLVTPEKLVPALGARTVTPIEVVPFARATVARHVRALGGAGGYRVAPGPAGGDARTDNGNLILDWGFGAMADAAAVDRALRAIPGVVDTGLFLGMADAVLVAEPDGVRVLERA